jgi:hypothetical protein
MSSSLRIDASLANGAKSRGPVTMAGKLASLANSAKSTGPVTTAGRARSSRNAIRHGILAESIVLDSESAERFSDVPTTLLEELQPTTSVESRYVETIALAEWRRLRLLCLEKEQITIETRRQEAADLSTLTNGGANDGDANEVSPIRYTALAFRAMSDESRARSCSIATKLAATASTSARSTASGPTAPTAGKDEKEARRAQRGKNGKQRK